MKLPEIFRKERSPQAAREAQDRAEKLLAETFRTLGQLCGKFADLIEAQRLARGGFEKPGRFLERLDRPGGSEDPPPVRPGDK